MEPESSAYSWLFSGNRDDKPLYIRQSLALAMEMRVDFHMDFFYDNHVIYQHKGICTQLEADHLKIYLRGEFNRLPPQGMEVHVYLSLRIEHKTLPCDFVAAVIGVVRENRDTFLLLSLPADMGHNQRRYNVRIPVAKKDIAHFRVWYGKPAGNSGHADDARRKVQWMPVPDEEVDVLDISAGGMHIGIAVTSSVLDSLARRELLLVNGEFDVKGKNLPPLAMVGPIVRLMREEKHAWARLGLQFRRWAMVRKGELNWLPLGEQDGIAPLGAWVFQVILSRYKSERES
jgi:hypothetical protein